MFKEQLRLLNPPPKRSSERSGGLRWRQNSAGNQDAQPNAREVKRPPQRKGEPGQHRAIDHPVRN